MGVSDRQEKEMTGLTITTNNQPRDIVYWFELTDKEQSEFDYLDTADRQDSGAFFRYRGGIYDLNGFMRTAGMPDFKGWHGYASDSAFSGILVKIVDRGERVIVASYYS
jgi:hypothetical protein